MRSDQIKKGFERAPHRGLLRGTGAIRSEADFDKPFIAIANSYTDIVPGHAHLQEVGRIVKEAVREAGGVPFEFNTIAVDDGIVMGHFGMKYSLPSRELIADCVETMVAAHCFDAMICIPNCDKIVPGMLMAAVRCNIPTVFVSGDNQVTAELREKIPRIRCAVVKKALGAYQARSLIPVRACELIAEGVKDGLAHVKEIPPFRLPGPLKLNLIDSPTHGPPFMRMMEESLEAANIEEGMMEFERRMPWCKFNVELPDGFKFP